MRVGNKRIRILVPTAILIIALMTMTLYLLKASDNNGKEIEDFAKHLVEICTHTVSSHIKTIEDVAFQFVANRDLNDVLEKYSLQQDRYQVAQSNMAFTNFLEGQAFFKPEIINAIFWDYDDPTKKALTMREEIANEAVLSLKLSGFASEIRMSGGKPVWIGGSFVSNDLKDTLLMGRIIKHTLKETPLGYLVVVVTNESLITAVRSSAESNLYYSIGSVKDELLAVINPSVTSGIIAIPDNADPNRISSVFNSLVPSLSTLDTQKTLITSKQLGEEKLLVTISSIPGTEWYLMLPMTLRSSTDYAFNNDKGLIDDLASIAIAAIALMIFINWWIGTSKIKTFVESEKPIGVAPSSSQNIDLIHPYGKNGLGGDVNPCENVTNLIKNDKTGILSKLTEKELRLLCLIARGYSNKKIADTIFVAEQTVKNSCSALYQKLGVEDRVGASVLATRLGLPIEDDEGRVR